MDEQSHRRVGRPSTQVLSRERIVEAALRFIDEHGNAEFVMRDLARDLGVRPSALYNHVEGKEDIFRGIREFIGGRISDDTLQQGTWDDSLWRWAHAYREAFAAHPPTIALLAVMPIHDESSVSVAYDHVVKVLRCAGWPHADAMSILVALESFILGSALDKAAEPDMMDPGAREDVPEFSAAYRERQALVEQTGMPPADLAFDRGLGAMIGGLRAEKAERDRE